MKNKYLRFISGIVCVSLAMVMTAGCVGQASKQAADVIIEPMEIEEVATYSFDYIGGKDVMPLLSMMSFMQIIV